MPLTLTAIAFPDEAIAKKFITIKRFDKTGGTIGFLRGRERDTADWRLPDPEQIINQIHAIIDYQQDKYWMVDVSINGTLVNGKNLHLDVHLISEEDTFTIGPVTFLPEIDSTENALNDRPLGYVIPNWIQKLIDDRKMPVLSIAFEAIHPTDESDCAKGQVSYDKLVIHGGYKSSYGGYKSGYPVVHSRGVLGESGQFKEEARLAEASNFEYINEAYHWVEDNIDFGDKKNSAIYLDFVLSTLVGRLLRIEGWKDAMQKVRDIIPASIARDVVQLHLEEEHGIVGWREFCVASMIVASYRLYDLVDELFTKLFPQIGPLHTDCPYLFACMLAELDHERAREIWQDVVDRYADTESGRINLETYENAKMHVNRST